MIKVVRDNVLVKPCKSSDISEGGIIVPDSAKKPSQKVEIIFVGNGTANEPMRLKVGDIGHRVKDCGTEVMINGELHFIVKQAWIIALN